MLVRYTLLTRPWYSAGTARCRTLVEVVPQMTAWAPKIVKMISASHNPAGQREEPGASGSR